MDQRLIKLAREGDIKGLYELIQQDPFILQNADQIPFTNTPLHEAIIAGECDFSMEIATLMPSFTRKLNQDGLSPMHLALKHGRKKIVRRLLAIDNTLVCVKGKERKTPLHEEVMSERNEFLYEFLSSCPESIEEVTNGCETSLHLAVRKNRIKALGLLLECVVRHNKKELLNWKDDEGNTILHRAVLTKNYKVVKLLLTKKNAGVEINAKNAKGQTARDISEAISEKTAQDKSEEISQRKIKEILRCEGARKAIQVPSTNNATCWCNTMGKYIELHWCRYFRFKRVRDSPNDVRNALLVVAVLIATATYQAGLSPPGGVWQDNYVPNFNNTNPTTPFTEDLEPQAGKVIMGHQKFLLFAFFNSAGFYTSLVMILILTSGFPMRELLNFSLISLLVTYISSMVGISPIQGPDHSFVLLFLLSMPLIFIILTVLTMMSSRYLFYKLLKKIRELCNKCGECVENLWKNLRARDGDLERSHQPRT